MSERQSGSQPAGRYINLTAANPMEYIRHTISVQLWKPIIVIRHFWHTLMYMKWCVCNCSFLLTNCETSFHLILICTNLNK